MATSKDTLLKKTKSLLRAVLASSNEVKSSELQADYEMVTLEPLPYRELGFPTVEAFMQSVADVVIISKNRFGDVVYKEAPSEATEHIKHLAKAKKKSSKAKPMQMSMRRPLMNRTAFSPPKQSWSHQVQRGGQRGRRGHNRTHQVSKPHYAASSRIVTFDGGQSLFTSRNFKDSVNSFTSFLPANSSSSSSLATRSYKRDTEVTDTWHQFRAATLEKNKSASYGHSDVRVAARKTLSQMKDVPPRYAALAKEPDIRAAEGKPWRISDGRTVTVNNSIKDDWKLLVDDQYLDRSWNEMTRDNSKTVVTGQSSGGHNRQVYKHGGDRNVSGDCCTLSVRVNVKSSQDDAENEMLRERIKKIMEKKSNGLFSTRLAKEYEEQFNESPPSDIIERLSSWPDIVTVETISLTGQKILYPTANSFTPLPQQTAVCTISHVILPKPGDRLRVKVTTVCDCSKFYVCKMSAPFVSLMKRIMELTKHKDNMPKVGDIDIGMFCIAKLHDDDWGRAEIIQIARRQGEVCYGVYYVDYGKTDTVPVMSIRYIPSSLCTLPAQAMRCSLSDCYPSGECWQEDSISEFKSLVMNPSAPLYLVMDVINVDCDHGCHVKLCTLNNLDIASKLVEEGFALTTPIGPEPPVLQYPDCQDWDVLVCYVNTTTDIVVRLVGEETSAKLEDLECTLATVAKQSSRDLDIVSNLATVGCVYMTPSDEDGEVYNRVRVRSLHGDKVEVEFLDHGDIDIIEVQQLKMLPPKYNQLPYQAIPAKLTGLESFENNNSIKKNLIELTLGKTFVAAVNNRGTRVSLTLWDTSDEGVDKNINEMVAMVLDIEELTLTFPEVGETVEGCVHYISETGHVFFQVLGPGLKTLEHMTAVVTETYDNLSIADTCVTCPVQGQLYCAKCMESWCRVEVLDVLSEQSVQVLFVDFGNQDVIDVSQLRVIAAKDSKIKDLPYQALECMLHGLPPGQYSWTDEALDRVMELAPEDEVRILKVIASSTPPQVELYLCANDTNLVSINEIISNETYLFQEEVKETSAVSDISNTSGISIGTDIVEPSGDVDQSRTQLPAPQIPPDSGDYIYVTWVEDPRNIWAVVYSQYPIMCEMMDKMQDFYKKETPVVDVSDVVEDELYAALYDYTWYRVVIKSVSPEANQVKVHFVDYGDNASLDISMLHVLPNSFRRLPFQAFRCKLEGLNPVGDEDTWPKDAVDRIRELIQEKVFTAWILNTAKDSTDALSVTLADFSESSKKCFIHKILLEEGLAK